MLLEKHIHESKQRLFMYAAIIVLAKLQEQEKYLIYRDFCLSPFVFKNISLFFF